MSSSSASSSPLPVCSVALVKKLPTISHEEFYHYITNVHANLAKPWLEKHGITAYAHIHTPPHLSPKNQQSGGAGGPRTLDAGVDDPFEGFDCMVIIQAPSFEVMGSAFEDVYYADVIAKDEAKFVDREKGVRWTKGLVQKFI